MTIRLGHNILNVYYIQLYLVKKYNYSFCEIRILNVINLHALYENVY